MLGMRDLEIAELKSKIAEVMALVPASFANVVSPPSPQSAMVSPHFSESFTVTPPPSLSMAGASGGSGGGGGAGDPSDHQQQQDNMVAAASSNLNPNASEYILPKV